MIYKTLHRKLKIEQQILTKNKQWSTKHYTENYRLSNRNLIKNKQWSAKHYTEN